MPTSDASPSCQASPLFLKIRGLVVPGFKNRKKMWGGRLVVDPEVGERMQEIQRSIASQLCSTIPIGADAMQMELWRLSAIASLPSDDCWMILPELRVSARLADDEPGCDILIERLS